MAKPMAVSLCSQDNAETRIHLQTLPGEFIELGVTELTFHIDLGLGLVIRALTAVEAPICKGDVLDHQGVLCSLSFDLYFVTGLQHDAVPHPLHLCRLGQLYLQSYVLPLFNCSGLQLLLEGD